MSLRLGEDDRRDVFDRLKARLGEWGELFRSGTPVIRQEHKAILKALRSEANTDVLLGCLAIQLVLETKVVSSELAPLADDTITSALGTAVTRPSPIVSAAALRSFCALVAALALMEVPEERSVQLARRSVPHMKTALAAQAKSVMVQEAVVQCACTLLAAGSWTIANNAGMLWTLLWPMSVHPRSKVAVPAAIALARLSWLAKVPGTTKSASGAEVLAADVAIATACAELGQLLLIVQQGSEAITHKGPSAASMAETQCIRLLELIQKLMQMGRSVVTSYGRKDSASLDDSLLVLPVGTIFEAVNTAVTIGAQAGSGSWSILRSALQTLSVVAHIAGTALLPFTAKLRRWIVLLVDSPDVVRQATHTHLCELLLALGQACPAVLLESKLHERLLAFALQTMKRATDGVGNTNAAAVPSASGKKRQTGRKRSAEDAFQGIAGSRDTGKLATYVGEEVQQVAAAMGVLARLLNLAAPIVPPTQVAAISEEVVHIVWLGLLAPRTTANSPGDAQAMAMCEALCRDSAAAFPLIDLIEALLQPPRVPVVRLAPELTDVFVLLLDTIATAHRHRVSFLTGTTKQGNSSLGGAVVAGHAKQAKEAVLLLHASAAANVAASSVKPTMITIMWPEATTKPAVVSDEAAPLPTGESQWPPTPLPSSSLVQASPRLSPAVRSQASPAIAAKAANSTPDLLGDSGLTPGLLPSPRRSPAIQPAPPRPPSGGGLFSGLLSIQPDAPYEATPDEKGSSAVPPKEPSTNLTKVGSSPVLGAAVATTPAAASGAGTETTGAATPLAVSKDKTPLRVPSDVASLPLEVSLQLFPDDGSQSPLPPLCLDSPSE